MAISLVGEVANTAESVTGWTLATASTENSFIQGTQSLGAKNSASIATLNTTSLGAGAPYDFSSGGSEEGYHILVWMNVLNIYTATTGLQIHVASGASNGQWNCLPLDTTYLGGWNLCIIDPERDFDSASTWSTTGNPAQLSSVSDMGGEFDITGSIMGNYHNILIDQITVGLGVRADAGSGGTPNTFETIRAADEGTIGSVWGFITSAKGTIVARGKIYLGPASGTTTSVFTDSDFVVSFSEERVATGFYEISTRGTNTDISWTRGTIFAANPTQARWSLTVDSTTKTFTDISGGYSGFDIVTANATSTFTSTSFINGNSIIQNGATFSGCNFLAGNNANGVPLIVADTAADISDCVFESGGVGHAVEIAPVGAGPFTINYSGNQDSGYAATDGSTGNETILINPDTSSADITLNIIGGGSTPTIMEDAGYTGTLTVVVDPVTLTVKATTTSGTDIQNARAIVLVGDGANFPYDATVTATSSSTTATITHTAHGLVTGDYVQITGSNMDNYNGAFQITVTGANTYTYIMTGADTSPATGTLKCTTVLLTGLTDVNGEIADTRSYGADQVITGRVRKSSGSPYYKTSAIVGTIDKASGLTANIQLISDE